MSDFFEYTDSGIRFKGFQDIRSELKTAWRVTFGNDIDLSPTSPDGHHVDLEARTINSVSEALELLTSSMNRNQAKGQFLDFLASFLNIRRAEGETDAQLLKRMDESDGIGYATFGGMLTYLQNELGGDIALAVNDESLTRDEMPPHTFRVTVPASNQSSDTKIGNAIWKCKPAGIKSVGNNSVNVTDAAGRTQVVYFSRPVDLPFCVKVSLSLYKEEDFPADGTELVKKAIVEWVSANYRPGTDVIPARFLVPIFSVQGISGAEISVRLSSSQTWSSDTISISSEAMAVIDEVTVSVG